MLAADERCAWRARHVLAEARSRRERTLAHERFRLPLHLHGVERLVDEDLARLPVGRLADHERADRGGCLQAGGGVDDVAGRDSLALLRARTECDHRLAGVDADPHLQLEPGLPLVQVGDRLQDAQAGADRPLGIVLVRYRCTEDGHHRVADELLDRAAEALDLAAEASVVGPDPRAHVLGVGRVRAGGETDEVTKENRDDLPLLGHGRPRLLERRAALEAKLRPLRVLFAAARAGRHEPSLRRNPDRNAPIR